LACQGDVEGLWNTLVDTPWDRIDREAVLKQLLQALEVRSKSDPEQFAAEVFERMTTLVTSLLLRSHIYLVTVLEQHGRAVRMRAQPPGDLPAVAVETLIPRTLQLQEHLATLLLSQAGVARQWALVRKNEAKAGRDGVAKPRRKAGQEEARTDPNRPSARPIDGNANDIVADLRNGPVRGTNGVHEGI
jgi:hypothetical protein